MKITTSKKEMNSLNNILSKKKEKSKKFLKIKHTESSGTEDEYQYYRNKPSKQRKYKQKYYGSEYFDYEDYCDGPRVKQNKRKNCYCEEEDDDDNSRNKKDTKKRRCQQEEYENYCNGDNEETSDNDIDKTNKKNTI